jgi:AraC-like DNA-binding protein
MAESDADAGAGNLGTSRVELPRGTKPFRRRLVAGVGADVLVERLAANYWPQHRHDHWQIVLLFAPAVCDGWWRTPSGETFDPRITGGQVWVLPPGWAHSEHLRKAGDVIVLYVAPSIARRYRAGLLHGASVASLTKYVAVQPAIAEICAELRPFGTMPNGDTDWDVACAGSHLAALVLQANVMLATGAVKPMGALAARVVEKLKSHSVDRRMEHVPVSEMARSLGISERHFRRVFREATGKSAQEWLLWKKSGHAKALLCEGRSVKETVDEAGFADRSHLNRVIRRFYGVSASAFRTRPSGPPVTK